MTPTPVVRLEAVSKSYSASGATTAVLHNVAFTIAVGEKASLIGPSGSGKSTLLGLIAGLLRPDKGSVAIDGVAMGELDDRERAELRANRIGIALQSDNLIPFLSAQENVELAIGLAGRYSRREAQSKATGLLERFAVAHRSDHRPKHLSGGEAQRVALAVAMANEPALLLADEVVGQLDAKTAASVVDEVLAADFAVLFVTHDLALADRAATRYVLDDGAIWAR